MSGATAEHRSRARTGELLCLGDRLTVGARSNLPDRHIVKDDKETGMHDPEPQVAAGKVHWAFMMSLDGFVAGPGHSMDFMERTTTRDGLLEEYIEATGAVLAGRDSYDSRTGIRPYGGAWTGPIFVLTHHPEDARQLEGFTILSCPVEEAVRIGLEAAQGKNLQVHSPAIGRQLLQRGLIDDIDIHIAPVLLGDGIRLYDAPGGDIIHLLRDGGEPTLSADVRYRPLPRTADA